MLDYVNYCGVALIEEKFIGKDRYFGADVTYEYVNDIMARLVSQIKILIENNWRPMGLPDEHFIRESMKDIAEGKEYINRY